MPRSKRLQNRRTSLRVSQKIKKNQPHARNKKCSEKIAELLPYKECRMTRSKLRLINKEKCSVLKAESRPISTGTFAAKGSVRPRREVRPPKKFMDQSFSAKPSSTLPTSSKAKSEQKKTNTIKVNQRLEGIFRSRHLITRNCMLDNVHTIINNKIISIDWYSNSKTIEFNFRNPLNMVYRLRDIPSYDYTLSCGYMIISPDFEVIDLAATGVTMFKVENGEALVKQQLQAIAMKPSFCFYVPLGSSYSIRNVSSSKPVVLFFSKVKALPQPTV